MSIKLYKHNKIAYKNVLDHFKESNRTCVIHPTGSGKSFISLKLIEDNIDKKCIILSPTYPILDQFKRTMLKVMLEINPDNLSQLEIDEIINDKYPNINFEIYSNVSERITENNYDIIILDEFHRCGANEWGKGINTLLDNNKYAKILGVSATPIRYLDDMRDMSKEIFYGDISSKITLMEAIADGILPVPTNINAIYSFKEDLEKIQKEIDKHRDKNKKEKLQKSLNLAKQKIEQAGGLSEIFKKYINNKSGKYLVFCKNINDMKEKEKEVLKWFGDINNNITISEVYHALGRNKNQEIIDLFTNNNDESLKLLFCIELLNEGLHVNGIDGVIMLRPTISPIIYFQQLGRALAVGKNNNPLVFDIVNNIDCVENIQNIKTEISKEIKRKKSSNGIEYTKQEINERTKRLLAFSVLDEYRDLRSILKQLEEDSKYNSWEENLKLLQLFLKSHNGKYPTKISKDEDEALLSDWVSTQRLIYNKGIFNEDGILVYEKSQLTPERIEKLNSIGFIWKHFDVKWEENFNKLKKFLEDKKRYPDKNSNDKDEKSLYSWVSTQRTKYNNGTPQEDGTLIFKGGVLTQEQIDRLNSIEFVWDIFDEKWEENFYRFYEFMKYHDDYPKKISTDKEEKKSANWVLNMRKIYNNGEQQPDDSIIHKGAVMSKRRIEKLKAIGFMFVDNEKVFQKKEVTTKGEMQGRKRYLEDKLEELLRIKENNINYENLDEIRKDFVKSLSIKKK